MIFWNVVLFVVCLVIAGPSKATEDYYHYCSEHYCAEVPTNVLVINKFNWQNYTSILPESIEEKYQNGSKRELWVFTGDVITVAVEYKHGKVRIDTPDTYCDTLERSLKETQLSCGNVFEHRRLKGLQAISYGGKNDYSFIRIFMPLNGGSVYFICSGKWESEKQVSMVYGRVVDIIKRIKIKRG